MNLSDLGGFAVLWLNKNGLNHGQNSAFAFFHTRPEAIAFMTQVGGELYLRHGDGQLKRV